MAMTLEEMLLNIDTASGRMGYVTIETEPKMRKTSNPYMGRVLKRSTIQFRLQNYVSVKANYNGVSQEETTVEPISWAEHLSKFVIQHKKTGERYFQLKPERGHATYFLDGKPAKPDDMESILSFIPDKTEGPNWISVKLKNIRRLSVDGKKFSV